MVGKHFRPWPRPPSLLGHKEHKGHKVPNPLCALCVLCGRTPAPPWGMRHPAAFPRMGWARGAGGKRSRLHSFLVPRPVRPGRVPLVPEELHDIDFPVPPQPVHMHARGEKPSKDIHLPRRVFHEQRLPYLRRGDAEPEPIPVPGHVKSFRIPSRGRKHPIDNQINPCQSIA